MANDSILGQSMVIRAVDASGNQRNVLANSDGSLAIAFSTSISDVVSLSTSTPNPVSLSTSVTNTVAISTVANQNLVGISTAAGVVQAGPILRSTGNITSATVSDSSTTGAVTAITIPAGRQWRGNISFSVAGGNIAATTTAGLIRGQVTISGAGATPAAGSMFMVCDTVIPAGIATGLDPVTGENSLTIPELVVNASTANAVNLQTTTTISTSTGKVNYIFAGELI